MSLPSRFRLVPVAFAFVWAGVAASAQQPERNYTLTDKTSAELSKVQPLLTAKNTAGALAIIDAQIPLTDLNSYDMAILQQVKAQIYLQNNELAKAIDPLERCLTLSNAHTPTFFDTKATVDFNYYLAALYFQEASGTKDPAQLRRYYDKAELYISQWVKLVPKPTPEGLSFYASLLYQRGVQDENNVDQARLKKAMEQADIGLRLSSHPRDSFYQLKLACQLQLGLNKDAAEILELLVKQKPDNKTYWQQLAALYLNTGQDIRSVLTMERAQAVGHMNAPKDNFNLVGIYFNIGQYEKAAELLEKGLRDGSIENEPKNWELLSYSYQQLRREYKAIGALKQAAKLFPGLGQFDYLIAQLYYSLEKPDEAFTHVSAAVKKGNLAKPHSSYLFLAYIAYELKKFEDALAAVEQALTYPDGVKDGTNMKGAILEAIKEREAKLNRM